MRGLLTGPNVKLTAIREDDLGIVAGWFNDVQFLRFYDFLPALPKRRDEVKLMLDGFADSSERTLFAVRTVENDCLIGIIGFDDIVWSNGVATVFIGIGDKSYTSKGFGKEAMQLLLDFGFHELNFHRLQLCVISYNAAAIRLYESLGFVREGTYRQGVLRDGERHDMYLYGLLKTEWRGPV